MHPDHQIPIVAFLFPGEAQRVMHELRNVNIESFVREVHCFGNGLQRVFALMDKNEAPNIIVSFTSQKDANSMSRILSETGNSYMVTEISCFEIIRKQALAKYILKYTSDVAGNRDLILYN